MRLTAYLLSAAATIAIAAPAAAQEATPTTNAERQVPSQGTAAGAVQATDVAAGFRGVVDRAAFVDVLVQAYADRSGRLAWPAA